MINQSLQQKFLQKLSPQQIQLMKLLQVPTIALEQRIKEELEINPALEEGREEEPMEFESEADNNFDEERNEDNSRDDFDLSDYISDDEEPSYKTYQNNSSPDDEDKSMPISMGKSFHELLSDQLGLQNLSDEQKVIGEYLIGNLDDSGYIRRELEAIVDDLAFYQNITTSEKELENVLKVIQTFDPPGVGCRDLRECLLIQIKRKSQSDPDIVMAKYILEDCFDEFSKKHYDKILKKFSIDEDELKDALDQILKLNPKPGNSMKESSKSEQVIVPDFYLNNEDGALQVILNGRNAPELKVSKDYLDMLKEYSAKKNKSENKEAVLFVKQKLDSAKWFIDAIKQRQNTLLVTMEAIVMYQKEYFLTGDDTKLKPMILKDIADIIGLDISTVSRVANSKYIQTDFGTFLIKSFFSESMENDAGEEVSTREIKKILQDCIAAEDKRKPLTDERLAEVLLEKGYPIARRTVAKYREQLNIPVGRMRKEL
ncbi:MAG: hypothetical protein RLZZ414_2086 [Bacteroidota bacterium]|jgi:RNA polymerase sigma-54 factor